MKKILLVFTAVSLWAGMAKAQTTKAEHTIKVVGTAELEIVPDEIYMSVTLKEYTKDKKKYAIEELEKNLVNYIEKVTITDKKDIKMDNMSGYVISMKRKNKDEIISKRYDVKFKNAQQVYLLYSVMDSLGISRAYVSKYSHSKMDEFKKQIKINAIKSAKEKANYLLEAINEKAGKAVNISERTGFVAVNDGTNDNNRNYNGLSNSSYNEYQSREIIAYDGNGAGYSGGTDDVMGDKTIKLSYEIDAEFEIQ